MKTLAKFLSGTGIIISFQTTAQVLRKLLQPLHTKANLKIPGKTLSNPPYKSWAHKSF